MRAGMTERLALSWSGGRDSAVALQELRRTGLEAAVLLTTVDEVSATVPQHGVSVALLERQAIAAGVSLVTADVPPAASNVTCEERLRAALAAPPLCELDAVAFGDLFLEDLRAYRESRMSEAGLRAVFPLWGRDTAALAQAFVADGFRDALRRWQQGTIFGSAVVARLSRTAAGGFTAT
jgi:diphthamide synthase (EF-2-diphthine--ammonia ligase)